MVRSYRYRAYPTRAQAATLMTWLALTRELYNAALEHRRDAWRKQRRRIALYDQYKALAEVRRERTEFGAVPILVLRGTIHRLEEAFGGFYRRARRGVAPGFPRFAGAGFKTLLIDDLVRLNPNRARGTALIPMLGKMKFKQHRPLEGTPKAMRLKLNGDGHWYISFACVDVPTKPLPPTGHDVGIDLGISTFAATSDGELFENPRALEHAQRRIARAQRVGARRKKGSNRRRKAVRLLARHHFHVAQVRRQRHIDVARALVAQYDAIYVEDLSISGLASGMLARSVHDAGWSGFLHWLNVKAEEAGREVVAVNPSGTSQRCSACGKEVRKTLAVRVHDCPNCGYVADRDVNAARNILALGRSVRRAAPGGNGTATTREESASHDRTTPDHAN